MHPEQLRYVPRISLFHDYFFLPTWNFTFATEKEGLTFRRAFTDRKSLSNNCYPLCTPELSLIYIHFGCEKN